MKIGIVGGIYAKGGGRKNYIAISPETVLEAGLRSAGHDVTALSHYDDGSFDSFDVVHVHHLSWGATRLASDSSRVPFVFTAHDATLMCGFSQPLSRRAAMRFVFSRADASVALSGLEANSQRRLYKLDGAIHSVIPNGIDADQYSFQRNNAAAKGQPWRLLFVGQLTSQKRVDLLLKAIPLLPSSVELTLVYQNGELENDLREIVATLGIGRQVHFAGKRNPAQLAALYQSSDLLVLPSAWEALPSVISEAMLCGLPFVASATGGIPEQAAGYGVLLQKRDHTEVANAISHVLEHYGRFAASGEAMAMHARDRFAIPKMIERHIRLYERVAAIAVPRRHAWQSAPLNAAVRNMLRWHSNASIPCAAVAART